jgi:hypothetical protein
MGLSASAAAAAAGSGELEARTGIAIRCYGWRTETEPLSETGASAGSAGAT